MTLVSQLATGFARVAAEIKAVRAAIPAAFTSEQAQDATAALFAAGSHTDLTFTYADNGDGAGSMSVAVLPGGAALTLSGVKTAPYTGKPGEIAMMQVNGGGNTFILPGSVPDRTQCGFRSMGATTAVPLSIQVTAGSTHTIGDSGATTASEPLGSTTRVYQLDAPTKRWLPLTDVKTLGSLDARFTAPLMQVKAPIAGAISPGYTNGTTSAPAIGDLILGLMLLPAGTYDLAAIRVQTPATGATVRIVAYTVDGGNGGPGTLLFQTAAVPATSGGYLGATLTAPLVVPNPGMVIWVGLVNQGIAAAAFWATNQAYGLPRVDSSAASIDLGGSNPPAQVRIAGVTAAPPASQPTHTWGNLNGQVYKVALRRSA